MEQLKSCPFCGSEAAKNLPSRPRGEEDFWCVFCQDCAVQGPEASTEVEAARLWNSRANPLIKPGQREAADPRMFSDERPWTPDSEW